MFLTRPNYVAPSGNKHPNWRGGNPMVECFTCGATFEIERELNILSDHHFCCNTCKSVWSSSRMTNFYSDIANREKHSAAMQGISYDEWEGFAKDKPYCPAFNEKCREANREKYDRKCFLCGLEESENVASTGMHRKLAVHHYDMNKDQGCDSHEWKLVPLCIGCHGSAHNDLVMNRIIYLLNNVWNTV